VKELTADVASMESAKGHTFTLPPRVWLVGRIAKLHELLAHRTEQSALALGRLTGPVTLSPEKPKGCDLIYAPPDVGGPISGCVVLSRV
jgi:hypothetical protein